MTYTKSITIILVATLLTLVAWIVSTDWRRVQRYEACETCVESGAPGVCGAICGQCKPRASPSSSATTPPPVGGGMGSESGIGTSEIPKE